MTAIVQTRRSVSVSRKVYDAARTLAAEQGVTLAHFVEIALRAAGVSAPEVEHQTPVRAERAVRRRIERRREVLSGWVRR